MATKKVREKSYTLQEMISLCVASDSSGSDESEGEIHLNDSSLEEIFDSSQDEAESDHEPVDIPATTENTDLEILPS